MTLPELRQTPVTFTLLNRYRKIAIATFWVTLVFGFGFSTPNDAGPLSRAGSFLVVVGLILAYLDFTGRMDKLREERYEDLSNSEEDLPPETTQPYSESERQRVMKLLGAIASHNASIHLTADSQSLRRLEFIIVGFGTLIWGFGDLATTNSAQNAPNYFLILWDYLTHLLLYLRS